LYVIRSENKEVSHSIKFIKTNWKEY
jgi:hypothetical protein